MRLEDGAGRVGELPRVALEVGEQVVVGPRLCGRRRLRPRLLGAGWSLARRRRAWGMPIPSRAAIRCPAGRRRDHGRRCGSAWRWSEPAWRPLWRPLGGRPRHWLAKRQTILLRYLSLYRFAQDHCVGAPGGGLASAAPTAPPWRPPPTAGGTAPCAGQAGREPWSLPRGRAPPEARLGRARRRRRPAGTRRSGRPRSRA